MENPPPVPLRPPVRDYRNLIVWRHAISLAGECHRLSAAMRGREMSGLRSQLCRSAISISANIAEGNGRTSRAEYLRFLGIASGSLREVESHLMVVLEVGLAPAAQVHHALRVAAQTGQLLRALIKRLRAGEQ